MSETLKEFNVEAENVYSFNTFREEWKIYCKFGFAIGFWYLRAKVADLEVVHEGVDSDGTELPLTLAPAKEEEFKQSIRHLVMHMYNNEFC